MMPDEELYVREPVQYPSLHVIDVAQEASVIATEHRNIVLNQINGGCLRLAVMSGEYPWHSHPSSDELFLVVEGRLVIELRDGSSFTLGPWQAVTVPAGTVHRTRAEVRTVNLCFEQLAAETLFVDTAPPRRILIGPSDKGIRDFGEPITGCQSPRIDTDRSNGAGTTNGVFHESSFDRRRRAE